MAPSDPEKIITSKMVPITPITSAVPGKSIKVASVLIGVLLQTLFKVSSDGEKNFHLVNCPPRIIQSTPFPIQIDQSQEHMQIATG